MKQKHCIGVLRTNILFLQFWKPQAQGQSQFGELEGGLFSFISSHGGEKGLDKRPSHYLMI